MSELRSHELLVKHVATGKEMVINKSRFNEQEFKIVKEPGEGDGSETKKFDAPNQPPTLTKNVTENVKPPVAPEKDAKVDAPAAPEKDAKASKSPTAAMKG